MERQQESALLYAKNMEECMDLLSYLRSQGIGYQVQNTTYSDDFTVILIIKAHVFTMKYTEETDTITICYHKNGSEINAKAKPDFNITFLDFIQKACQPPPGLSSACIQLLSKIDRITM